MTPVVKSMFTDLGMEITSDAMQIFGGYGYTKDQGIEQLYRDNRITPIYEGTNSVQAIDLVFRKITEDETFKNLISNIEEEIDQCSKNEKLSKHLNSINDFKKRLIEFTNWINPKGSTPKNDISASCNDYLKFLGYFCLSFVWLKTLRKSYENYDQNTEFYDDKINTGNYYFEKIIPRAEAHYKSAVVGSKYTMDAKFN